MAVWSSTYMAIQLRYGGLGMDSLAIGTLKIMASTGVFVRVVCALKRSIENFPSSSSVILT